jgi:hypothetical protein
MKREYKCKKYEKAEGFAQRRTLKVDEKILTGISSRREYESGQYTHIQLNWRISDIN